MYYRGAQGVAFVFDITSRSSLESVDAWVKEFQENCDGNS